MFSINKGISTAPAALFSKIYPVLPLSGYGTITNGIANAASTIASAVSIAPSSSVFTFSAPMIAAGAGYPDNLFYKAQGVNYGNGYQCNSYLIDFMFDGQIFEVYTKGMGSSAVMRILVDGAFISASASNYYPSDGSLYLTKIDLGSASNRKITIECSGNTFFGGLKIPPTNTVGMFKNNLPRIQVFGDSYTEGGVGQSNVQSYVNNLGRLLQAYTISSGVGATGYISASTPKIKLRDRLPTDLVSADIYILAMGVNDTGSTDSDITTEAGLCVDYIKANGLGSSKIIMLSPWSPRHATRVSLNTALKTLATSKGIYFIDSIGDGTDSIATGSWITGTGRVGTTTGVGNSDVYTMADGTHPTTSGHEYLAYRLAKSIIDLSS